jgi:RNA polymerase sigma factor (sigma-70 family)
MRSEAVVREFQRLLEPGTVAGLTERQVLERFAERGDSVAFEAIVTRHGPMVYTVCRQMLRDPNDVDDAFQATFLILIKKASKLRQPERLGPWLYGVAYRVARRLRTRPPTSDLPENLAGPRLACPVEDNESVEALHDEIQRLPEKYRVPIVLCCIEGLSHADAARRLGWPVGTVHGRLSRARERLRDRLKRRGVSVSEVIPDALALIRSGQVILPDATRLAALALVRGTVPASLDILTKGVLFAMITEKLKHTGIILVITLVGLGTATGALRAYQGQVAKKPEAERQAAVAGVQAEPRERTSGPHQSRRDAIVEDKPNDEIALERLDEWRANAEMMQIKLEDLRESMRTHRRLQNRIEMQFPEDGKFTQQFANDKRSKQRELEERYEHASRRYRESLSKLAAIRRDIARDSKALESTNRNVPNATATEERLGRFEDKLNRIIEALNGNTIN